MADANDPQSGHASGAIRAGSPGTSAGMRGAEPARSPHHETPAANAAEGKTGDTPRVTHPWRRRVILLAVLAGLAAGTIALLPMIQTALNTVSTDDAYVNGHVTFVASRVSGQVAAVLVDDNMRVKKGTILVQLDKEPYQIKLAIKQAAVAAGQADLTAAQARAHGVVGIVRAARFGLERAVEDVNTRIADLRAYVATVKSKKASLDLARANLKRGEELLPSGGISKEEQETRRQQVLVADAAVDQAQQAVYASRVGLGLPIDPGPGKDLGSVPPGLEDNYSAVRQALQQLAQSVAELGYVPPSLEATPKEAMASFLKQDPQGNIERIYAKLIANAPAVKQAETKLEEAKRDLAQAELELRYCDVVAEIDGVVTRRNVNPGNNVQPGQSLMAVRSLTEIWIDANFKETQLANLRIGQRARCDIDMYGSHRQFEGRITGFTMGTGQTLSLLPPQNATGNFVKIVQRLPVRIELTDYDPDKVPVFIGLSVVPYVYYKEAPSGPHAGELLQPFQVLPVGQAVTPADAAHSKPAPSPSTTRAVPRT